MIGLTYAELKALNPYDGSLQRAAKLLGGPHKWKTKVTAAQARDAGIPFDDILWAVSALALTDKEIERRLRLWMADLAARVLHIFERDYPKDERPRNAIIATRQFARGEIGDAAAAAAGAAAWDAAAAAEQEWQFDRLIARLDDPEPNDWPLPIIAKEVA